MLIQIYHIKYFMSRDNILNKIAVVICSDLNKRKKIIDILHWGLYFLPFVFHFGANCVGNSNQKMYIDILCTFFGFNLRY